MYYGHLLEALKKYDEAVGQYEKAIQLDPTKTDLYKISLLLMNRRMIIKKQSVLTRNIIHPLIRNTRLRIYNSSLADFIMVQVRRLIR